MFTTVGELRIHRRYFACDDCGGKQIPMDAWADIGPRMVSEHTRRVVTLADSSWPFDEAASNLQDLYHLKISDDTIERVCQEVGQRCGEWMQEDPATTQMIQQAPGEQEFSTDGGKLNTLDQLASIASHDEAVQDFAGFCNQGGLGSSAGFVDHGGMHAIELENVSKCFGDHHAVDDLSLRVPTGSIFGFIGPNGSGKSTTLRMIMHIIHADRGRIRVLGEETHSAANDRIGYLPEERGLYRQMKVVDLLKFFSQLKGHAVSKAEIDGWLERVQLQQWGNRKVEALSKGMSQKVQFLATIIARPQLLLLDEPFSGLDPVNAEVVREIMLELVRGGTTVLFSTHDMLAAEALCDQILMIYNGKKVLDGTLRQIQTEHGGDMLRIRVDWPAGSARRLDDLPGVTKVTDLGNLQDLSLASGVDRHQILSLLMQRGQVEHFELTRPSLKDIFLQIAKGDQS